MSVSFHLRDLNGDVRVLKILSCFDRVALAIESPDGMERMVVSMTHDDAKMIARFLIMPEEME